MKKSLKRLSHENRLPYIKPQITVLEIKLEDTIITGSAKVIETNSNNEIQQEWENGTDINRDFNL